MGPISFENILQDSLDILVIVQGYIVPAIRVGNMEGAINSGGKTAGLVPSR